MTRFRTPLLILGLIGALVVAAAVVLVVRLGRGTPVQLPVAIEDIPPGTELSPQQFRLTEVRGLDREALDAYITADEFAGYVGRPLLETVHAGFPVGKAQVDPELQSRLTLALSDPTHLVYPLPVNADQVGNYIVAGDYVDVIFALGRVAEQEMSRAYTAPEVGVGSRRVTTPTETTGAVTMAVAQPTPTPLRPGTVVTETLRLPLAKVILADVPVLRVEREQVRSASAAYGLAGEETRQTTLEGDVLRLYLEVDREQAEVLSFALHNGVLNLPAHAQPIGGETEGFTWDDFVEMFFQDRP